MAGGSTLDPDNLPGGLAGRGAVPDGHSTGALGPSDRSDTGSDVSHGGALDPSVLGSDADASATGEEAGSPGRADGAAIGADIGFDRVVGPEEAGLGSGLDQAEEALASMSDDELAAAGLDGVDLEDVDLEVPDMPEVLEIRDDPEDAADEDAADDRAR
jgi:hypothetical protein